MRAASTPGSTACWQSAWSSGALPDPSPRVNVVTPFLELFAVLGLPDWEFQNADLHVGERGSRFQFFQWPHYYLFQKSILNRVRLWYSYPSAGSAYQGSLYIHSRISHSVRAKSQDSQMHFQNPGWQAGKWGLAGMGLLTAWFSLFLSINKASPTGRLPVVRRLLRERGPVHTPPRTASEIPRTSGSPLGPRVYKVCVTVRFETRRLLDVRIFLEGLKSNSERLGNPHHVSSYTALSTSW